MKAEPTLTTIGGIHHVTSIAADRKRTEEFYAGTLGLHLVRKTVNFDEPSVLHFYFGDTRGSPGSMITFFVHEAEPPDRARRGLNRHSLVVRRRVCLLQRPGWPRVGPDRRSLRCRPERP